MSLSVLDREMFSEPEAARLLRVAPSTLHYWLEGGQRRGKTYQPVIRVEPEGRRSVTWAEFIEAGLLREYRREHNPPWPSCGPSSRSSETAWGCLTPSLIIAPS